LGLAIAVPVFLALLIVSFVIEQALAPSFGVQGVGLPFPNPIPFDRCSPQRAKGRTTISRTLPTTVRRLPTEAKH
jgi:hypothetical protein